MKIFVLSHLTKEASLRGEWWIIDGTAHFADIETGEIGHEGYVIEACLNNVLSLFNMDASDEEISGNLSNYEDQILSYLIYNEEEFVYNYLGISEDDDYAEFEIKEKLNDDPMQVIDAYARQEGLEDATVVISIAYGASSLTSVREYAMEKWGWIRVESNHIESWTFTEKDFQNTVRGLWDILGDDETINDKINIEVRGNNKYYSNVNLDSFLEGSYQNFISELRGKSLTY